MKLIIRWECKRLCKEVTEIFEEPSFSGFLWFKPRSCDVTCRGALRENILCHGACLSILQSCTDETAVVKASKLMVWRVCTAWQPGGGSKNTSSLYEAFVVAVNWFWSRRQLLNLALLCRECCWTSAISNRWIRTPVLLAKSCGG